MLSEGRAVNCRSTPLFLPLSFGLYPLFVPPSELFLLYPFIFSESIPVLNSGISVEIFSIEFSGRVLIFELICGILLVRLDAFPCAAGAGPVSVPDFAIRSNLFTFY